MCALSKKISKVKARMLNKHRVGFCYEIDDAVPEAIIHLAIDKRIDIAAINEALLYKVTNDLLIDLKRKQSRNNQTGSVNYDEESPDNFNNHLISGMGEFDNIEIWEDLKKSPVKDIDIIYLHNYQGYSFEEIAKKKNMTIDAIYKRYERAVPEAAKYFNIPPHAKIEPEKIKIKNKYCRKVPFFFGLYLEREQILIEKASYLEIMN